MLEEWPPITLPNEHLSRGADGAGSCLLAAQASYCCMSWIASSSVSSHMRRLGRQLYRNTRSGETCKLPSCVICFPPFGKGMWAGKETILSRDPG
jgi:hypothetical protein